MNLLSNQATGRSLVLIVRSAMLLSRSITTRRSVTKPRLLAPLVQKVLARGLVQSEALVVKMAL